MGGTPERKMNTSTKAQMQTGAVIRRQEDTSDDCVATGGAQMIEGNSLVLMQVNCRNILNTSLEFLNLIDTYNPDVIIGRSHGSERKLALPKYLGTNTQLSGEIGILEVVECLFV
jgi:hypothetical protein